MKKEYCKYCHYEDLGEIYDGGEKNLWEYEGSLLTYGIELELCIYNGKMYMHTSSDTGFGIYGEPINYCPMCGEKIKHPEETA